MSPRKKKPPVKTEHKKTFRLSPDEMDQLKEIMNDESCNTENGAIKKIISNYLILKYDLKTARAKTYSLEGNVEDQNRSIMNFKNAFNDLQPIED